MPILKYKCNECGKEFTKIFVNPEKAPRECPVCGSANPEEVGAAFNAEDKSLDRFFCVSCDSCGDESACSLPEGADSYVRPVQRDRP
ncbi:MAG: FmdB family zinc ribbon protein [Desulfomonile sp.]